MLRVTRVGLVIEDPEHSDSDNTVSFTNNCPLLSEYRMCIILEFDTILTSFFGTQNKDAVFKTIPLLGSIELRKRLSNGQKVHSFVDASQTSTATTLVAFIAIRTVSDLLFS